MPDLTPAVEACLTERFGLPEFRPGQIEVIERLMAGKSVAAVFPTGGGKSLCYQLPSQLLPGMTVIVSPLIALMKDQCDAMAARGIRAARLDSTLTNDEFREAMAGIRDGSIKMLYVAPERFFNERFLASVGSLDVSLMAIDEAHCISQWGHNFRPDYLKLAELAKRLGAGRVLALTATATPSVLADIRAAFDIADGDAICTPFHRPNLQLLSAVVDSGETYDHLLDRLKSRPPGATIVYVTLQRTAEEIAERLVGDGIEATAYHAGLKPEERTEIQRQFLSRSDSTIVATIAFGMGIDKADIRYVYHFNPPKSLESYAQEIGRAGRDGEASTCELLIDPEDRIVLENFVYGDTPTLGSVETLMRILSGQPETFHLSHYSLSSETNIRILVVRTLLVYLELDGLIESTSPRYDTYKLKPFLSTEQILVKLKGEPREFAAGVLATLSKGRTWLLLNPTVAARQLKADRQRVVAMVEYFVERGWVEVQVAGLMHGYRRRKSLGNVDSLAAGYHERLVVREAGEAERIDQVFELAAASNCLPGRLAEHFGQPTDQSCGQCTACLGAGPFDIPAPSHRQIGSAGRRAIDDAVRQYGELLADPRDRAKFLCGLATPAFQRAKLTRAAGFGVCDLVPFADVLAAVS